MTFSSNIIALRPAGFGPMPKLIPDGIDSLLERRFDAELMAERIIHETQQPYHMARLHVDFARRLGAIAARRAQA